MVSTVQYGLMCAIQHMGDEAKKGGKATFSDHTKSGSQLTSHPSILKCGCE